MPLQTSLNKQEATYIVGVLYTGSLPERPSFNDTVLTPVSEKWKGKCETGPEFPAAGSIVKNAAVFEYAVWEAEGMAIRAWIAVYKICWSSGCYDSHILAAMDQAVADGVDVISLSVGANGYAPRYDQDSIAIRAFGAMERGMLVSCSSGNSGPGPYTAVNIAPWREFPSDVILGVGGFWAAFHCILVSH
ncbi:subtilisin-like protease SBT1.4 [Papaver somniferum]|uniref:subtilisin-like protease SBT1.4 n=1 Tax=Papaver somniferum TaxID=3469 RepID=UPI000E703FEF|nr:subtilisin-like protease SBT1.4 [Papaver somniferum]